MDSIKEKLVSWRNPKNERPLAINSIEKVYMVKLNKLRKNLAPDDLDAKFLENTDLVLPYVKNIEHLETRKSYLSSITTICNVLGVPCVKYCEYLTEVIQLIKQKDINQKTEKEDKNWVKITELKSIIPYYEKLMKDNIGDLKLYNRYIKYWMIACLYCLDDANPPCRLDYSVLITNKEDFDEKINDNFLVLNKGEPEFFSFADYKSSSKYGTTKIRVGKKLKPAIKFWMKYSDNKDILLPDGLGKRMTRSALGQLIPRVFEPVGKHITLNTLRHVYITDNLEYGDMQLTKKRRITAQRMMHSVRTQENYVKI